MSSGLASRTFSGPADGRTAADLRSRLRSWLSNTVNISDERACDIVLAASEALAKGAEHAYRGRVEAGTMTLTVVYDPTRAVIELLATDDGRWSEPTPRDRGGVRGRGLPLIEALSDECDIDGDPRGTTVRMRFASCPPRDEATEVRVKRAQSRESGS